MKDEINENYERFIQDFENIVNIINKKKNNFKLNKSDREILENRALIIRVILLTLKLSQHVKKQEDFVNETFTEIVRILENLMKIVSIDSKVGSKLQEEIKNIEKEKIKIQKFQLAENVKLDFGFFKNLIDSGSD